MFCVNCGTQLADGAKFCTGCGAPIGQEMPAPPVEMVAPAEEAQPAPVVEEVAPVEEEEPIVVEEIAPVVEAQPVPVVEAELTVDQPYAPPVYQSTVVATVAEERQYVPSAVVPIVDSPIAKLKKVSGSAVVLIATILYSLLALLQLVGIFSQNTSILGGYEYMLPSETLLSFSLIGTLAKLFSVIGMTPMILMLIGLWVNFAHAKNPNALQTSGLTLVKSAMILRLIGKFLLVALTLALGGFLIYYVNASYDALLYDAYGAYGAATMATEGSSMITTAIVIYMLIILLVLTLPIVYDFLVISTTNAMKRTLHTNVPYLNGCGGLCVLNYILAAFSALGLLLSFVMNDLIAAIFSSAFAYETSADSLMAQSILSSLYKIDAVDVFTQLITIAVLVLFSVSLSMYRRKVNQ